jgi:hypothetical protein
VRASARTDRRQLPIAKTVDLDLGEFRGARAGVDALEPFVPRAARYRATDLAREENDGVSGDTRLATRSTAAAMLRSLL